VVRHFVDTDGRKYDLWFRGAYAHIRSGSRLRETLDRSIAKAPYLKSHTYLYVMRYFGMIAKSKEVKA
jgi:hypothetical protein